MKSLSFLLFSFLCLAACKSKEPSRPDTIIPKEKMVLILSDIHLAEGIVSTADFTKDSSLLLFTEIENQILSKHGVTEKQFRESYDWYASHVELYKELYTEVVDTLNVRTSSELEEKAK